MLYIFLLFRNTFQELLQLWKLIGLLQRRLIQLLLRTNNNKRNPRMFRKTSELSLRYNPRNRLDSIIRILTWNRNPEIVVCTGWNDLLICMYRSVSRYAASRRRDHLTSVKLWATTRKSEKSIDVIELHWRFRLGTHLPTWQDVKFVVISDSQNSFSDEWNVNYPNIDYDVH